MAKPTDQPFFSGEVAVLKHEMGGRLFVVASCRQTGSAHVVEKVWRVIEQDDRQPRQPDHEVSAGQLIKVKNRDKAIELVGMLRLVYEVYQDEVRNAATVRDTRWRRVIGEFEVIIDDEVDD